MAIVAYQSHLPQCRQQWQRYGFFLSLLFGWPSSYSISLFPCEQSWFITISCNVSDPVANRVRQRARTTLFVPISNGWQQRDLQLKGK